MIQFGPSQHGSYKDCFYQDTAVYDILHFDDAMSHSIMMNDKVLALIDGAEKYAPAEVLEGLEKRTSANVQSSLSSREIFLLFHFVEKNQKHFSIELFGFKDL